MDHIDRKILHLLQEDAGAAVADLARQIGLSTTPCWRRIQRMEEDGVIKKRVALLDPEAVNVPVTAFVSIRIDSHKAEGIKRLSDFANSRPEVVEFYRMGGDVDYLMRITVPDIATYDRFYSRLIEEVDIRDVSASFAMEQIKYSTKLPLDYMILEREAD